MLNLDQQQALSSPSAQVVPPHARISLTPPLLLLLLLLLEPLALEVDEPVVLELEALEALDDEEVVVVVLVVVALDEVVEVVEVVAPVVLVDPPAPVVP